MLALLDHSPDIYLDEIQAQLSEMHGLDVSLATIYRTLKRLGIGSKKVSLPPLSRILTILSLSCKLSKAAAERSEEARREFRLEIGAEPPERIVTADESAVNLLTTYRQNGWSYRGIRARKKCKFVRGTRYVVCWLLCCSDWSYIRLDIPFSLPYPLTASSTVTSKLVDTVAKTLWCTLKGLLHI